MELPNGVPLDVAQAQLVKFSPAQEAARKVFERMYGPMPGGAGAGPLQAPLQDQSSSHSGPSNQPGDMDTVLLEEEVSNSGLLNREAANEGAPSLKSAAEQLAVRVPVGVFLLVHICGFAGLESCNQGNSKWAWFEQVGALGGV
jgi:hypothetical protein